MGPAEWESNNGECIRQMFRLVTVFGKVVVRYFMGYWPAKIPTFLNIVLMVAQQSSMSLRLTLLL